MFVILGLIKYEGETFLGVYTSMKKAEKALLENTVKFDDYRIVEVEKNMPTKAYW
tara:strand:+ start:167 stop:331 length:165 start_codon:yes stop_codon:yes gene_type:complete